MTNILKSKAPLMVALRYALVVTIILMGIARLRLTLIILSLPENFKERDILQIYLMMKALLSGMNPYLPLNELAEKFVGVFPFFPHPAPYPPFVTIFFTPLLLLNISNSIIAWYVFEIICLAAIACILTVIWKGRLTWVGAIILFFLLLAWFPIMADLEVGQLSILLTLLILSALLALHKDRRIIAGILIGLSVAIKVIAWPLIIYLLLKKDWRTSIASTITAFGLNFIALILMGIGPFLDYYLRVSTQVMTFYRAELSNFSLWSFGYRLFTGTGSIIFVNSLKAPPLLSVPGIAPSVSAILAVTFLVVGLVFALQSKDLDTGFAIMVCVIVAVSPIVWDHYFVMLIISLVVMLRNLVKHSFPAMQTLTYSVIALFFFLFNDQIGIITMVLNGGKELVRANGNQITFASSLLFCLPVLELILLSILLWRSKVSENHINNPST